MSEGVDSPMAAAPAATEPAPATAQAPAVERINLMYHAIIGAAVGVTAAFTALAWPVAMVLGYRPRARWRERPPARRPVDASR